MSDCEIYRLSIGDHSFELADVEFTESNAVQQTWGPTPSHWSFSLEIPMSEAELDTLFEILCATLTNDIDLMPYVEFAEARGHRVTAAWVDRWAGELRLATEVMR